DAAGRVLAGDQAATGIVGVPVGHIGRPAEGRDAVPLRPATHVVAGHVAEDQVLLARMPDGSLGEVEAGAELFKLDVTPDDFLESGIADINAHHALSRSA